MDNYTPEQVQECVVMAEQNWPGSHIAGMLRDYATLRQQAGRVDEGQFVAHPSGDGSIVRKGDQTRLTVDEILAAMNTAALAQNTQGEAVAWRECYGAIIKALAAMTHVGAPDHWPEDAIQRDPIMEQVRRIRQALDTFGKQQLHAERARVPDGWVPRAVAEVAQGDLHMLKKAIEARDPWPELLVRVNDTERDLRTALAAAPSQRAEVKAEERAVGVCGCGMAGIMVERNGERVCSDCRPADRVEVK